MSELVLTSPAFLEGEWIPLEHSARGRDISPELNMSGICNEAISMAITMDDASHPLFPDFNHWVIWNLPVQNTIPTAIPKGEKIGSLAKAIQGNAYGKHCYKGPKPPFKSIHHYRFTVYILDCLIALDPNNNRDTLLKEIEGHILQKATLTAKFQSHRR